MVDSPAYDCQLVLVVNETAVFQARAGPTAPSPFGLSGSTACRRRMA